MTRPSARRLFEIRVAAAECSYEGQCNSQRCPKHGGEAIARRDLIAEIDALTEERDALRALPVITDCSVCAHRMTNGSHGHCVHGSLTTARAVNVDLPPPTWCPLRGRP